MASTCPPAVLSDDHIDPRFTVASKWHVRMAPARDAWPLAPLRTTSSP